MAIPEISAAQARRIALAAQGFGQPRRTGEERAGGPDGAIGRGHLGRILGRIGLLQIDSVSALVRAHYLPLFSRLGAYPWLRSCPIEWCRSCG